MLLTFLTFSALFLSVLQGCVPLKGINAANPSNPGVNEINPNPFNTPFTIASPDGMQGWFFPFVILQEVVFDTEPAIDFRIVTYNTLSMYNSIEAYSDNYMEAWGREDVDAARQFCINGIDESLLNDYKAVVIAYALYFSSRRFYFAIGLEEDVLNDFFENTVGYIPNICDNPNYGCDDTSTPWGFANMIVEEIYEWSLTDGYNHDGSYNREYNRIPYQDWRDNPFVPANNPWKLENPDLWQPLLESNNIGFLYNQEHVVSHIGFTARNFYLTDEYACSRNVPDPNYDYELEIDLLLERMANLNDFKKGETELYDNKGESVLLTTLLFDIQRGLFPYNAEFYLNVFLATDISMESTHIVWRNKVLQNRIRPPSIIHYLRGDEDITTYAGVDAEGNSQGTQTFKGRDFEGYIRTMPHAEYPSGSACLCEAVTLFYSTMMGSDDIPPFTFGNNPVQLRWQQGESKKEANTPAQDVIYNYNKWSEISFACGIGRLNGGLHFTASIEASNELCGDVGVRIADVQDALKNGRRPDYVIDFNDPANRELVQDRCGDYTDRDGEGEGRESSEDEDGDDDNNNKWWERYGNNYRQRGERGRQRSRRGENEDDDDDDGNNRGRWSSYFNNNNNYDRRRN